MPLSDIILCAQCAYNDVCPMANLHKVFEAGQGEVRHHRLELASRVPGFAAMIMCKEAPEK